MGKSLRAHHNYKCISLAGLGLLLLVAAIFMHDIGFTGGGAGSGMIYTLGKTDHKIDNDKMIEHIVSLVEERAKDLSKRQ